MKKILIISLIVIIAAGLAGGATVYGAGQFIPCGDIGIGQPDCTLCHFFQMIQNIMTFLVNTSFVVVSLMVGIGGIMYMLSGMELGIKIETAKKTITSALWGFIIVMSAWLIINSMLMAMGYVEANIGLKSVGNQFILNCEDKK